MQARARRAAADLEKLPRLFKELPSFLEKLSALATLSLLEGGERGGAASSSWLGRRKLTPLEADDGRDDAVVDLAGEELSVADDLAPLPLRCRNELRPICTGDDEGGGQMEELCVRRRACRLQVAAERRCLAGPA